MTMVRRKGSKVTGEGQRRQYRIRAWLVLGFLYSSDQNGPLGWHRSIRTSTVLKIPIYTDKSRFFVKTVRSNRGPSFPTAHRKKKQQGNTQQTPRTHVWA